MKTALTLALLLPLAACSTPAKNSGFLSTYDGLTTKPGAARASVAIKPAGPDIAALRKVALQPTVMAQAAAASWMTPVERDLLLREIDAQLCFELSERYEIAASDAPDAAQVRAAVVAVTPTGRVGSAAAAAASFFVPGPIGIRAPGTLGTLSAEAEMLLGGRQVAALSWSRTAMALGTDDPSLSRVGDALQFAEPFADQAAAAMTAPGVKSPGPAKPDPCAAYGPRFRPEGVLAGFATGLYVPEMSGAKKADE
ncbi:DUF3313 family protein [Phenylobacterium sp.]|uniref:DUF3313 family protein n=1 Tax=Phenylobacterium sp. TaxID=1871053 RepID=UPI00286A6C07|nr:DUF3313 family protein [Phenylobacterium sp.]